MSENNENNAQGAASGEQNNQEQQGQGGDVVTLRPDQWNAILDRMAELEEIATNAAKGSGGQNREPLTVDDLADQLQNRGQGNKQIDPRQLEQLSNAQLMGLIMQQVEQNIGQPLLIKLEEMRVRDEVKELRKELKELEVPDDIDSMKEVIFKVAARNPNLSIKEAYILAKGGRMPTKGEKNNEDTDGGDNTQKGKGTLFNLPPRANIVGEKPTHSSGSMGGISPQTRMEAASKAFDELEKKGLFK